MSETIALFGTSADPPTVAHQSILVWLGQRYDQVLVWAADNPFKPDQTSLSHRQEMLRLLLDSIPSGLENVQWKPELSHRYSLTSVQKVKEQWPDAELNLVVGSDILPALEDWYAIDQLMQLVCFVVMHRPGSPIDGVALKNFQMSGGKIKLADFSGPDVSSSDFRRFGRSDIVPPLVLEYLCRHHLYQSVDLHV